MARSFANTATDYLEHVGSLISATAPRPISVGVWFKAASRGVTHSIFCNNKSNNPRLWMAVLDAGGGNDKLSLYSQGFADSSTFVLSTTAWTHLGWTWDTDNAVAFYVNGIARGTAAIAPSGLTTDTAVIGAIDGVLFPPNGSLAEFAAWNAILNASEFASLGARVNPLRIRPQNLIQYVPIHGAFAPEHNVVGSGPWAIVGTLTPSAHAPVASPVTGPDWVPYIILRSPPVIFVEASPRVFGVESTARSFALTGAAMSVSFSPGRVEIGSRETVTIRANMRPLLQSGQVIASPASALWDVGQNASYGSGLSGAPSSTGDFIEQTITGLVSGHTYRLMIGMTPAGANTLYNSVLIACPEGWS